MGPKHEETSPNLSSEWITFVFYNMKIWLETPEILVCWQTHGGIDTQAIQSRLFINIVYFGKEMTLLQFERL